VPEPTCLVVNTGLKVRFLGLRIPGHNEKAAMDYLQKFVLGKEVLLKFDREPILNAQMVEAYVYLKNKIFVNKRLLQAGIASVDDSTDFKMKEKFISLTG
jgi:endonuclease YncB( thermonuclease family)